MKYYVFFLASLFCFLIALSCKPKEINNSTNAQMTFDDRIVLAQWSFNRELFKGEMTTFDFLKAAKEMGFVGVEYVNQFFLEKVDDFDYLDSLKMTADNLGMKNTLLMIDRAGNLGASNEALRKEAVEEHKRWIIAAKRLGCPNIRVNAHGDGTRKEVMDACKKSISELGKYGKQHDVGILIENHGSYSSDGMWILELVESLKVDGIFSLADFDNWCIERENGELWGAPCIKEYDRYVGMSQLLPSAKSVSIKAFDFDKDGMPIKTDFKKMFDLIHKSGYSGYLAIEFEGHEMDAKEGILKTMALAKRLYEK